MHMPLTAQSRYNKAIQMQWPEHGCTRLGPRTTTREVAMHPQSTIPAGLCQCGCGGRTLLAQQTRSDRGYRKGEPIRYLPNHRRGPYRPRPCIPPLVRLWAKVRFTPMCWEWTGWRLPGGYGTLGSPGRGTQLVHRLVWEAMYGTVPANLFVCHHCDNPACVRPSHLFLGTALDNNRDMFAKGRGGMQRHPERAPRGEHNAAAKLTTAQVREIRARYTAGGMTHKMLAHEYGVSASLVTQIVLRQAWRHVV